MIRALLAFVLFFGVFYLGINEWRRLSNRAKWTLTKTSAYAILCSALAVASLTAIVILF